MRKKSISSTHPSLLLPPLEVLLVVSAARVEITDAEPSDSGLGDPSQPQTARISRRRAPNVPSEMADLILSINWSVHEML